MIPLIICKHNYRLLYRSGQTEFRLWVVSLFLTLVCLFITDFNPPVPVLANKYFIFPINCRFFVTIFMRWIYYTQWLPSETISLLSTSSCRGYQPHDERSWVENIKWVEKHGVPQTILTHVRDYSTHRLEVKGIYNNHPSKLQVIKVLMTILINLIDQYNIDIYPSYWGRDMYVSEGLHL
jgi:hypothetical protein